MEIISFSKGRQSFFIPMLVCLGSGLYLQVALATNCPTLDECTCLHEEILPSGQWRVATKMGTGIGTTGGVIAVLPKESVIDLEMTGCEEPVSIGFQSEEQGYIGWKAAPLSRFEKTIQDELPKDFRQYNMENLYYGVTHIPYGSQSVQSRFFLMLRPGDPKAQPRRATADFYGYFGPIVIESGQVFYMSMVSKAMELEYLNSSERLKQRRWEACRCDELDRELKGQRLIYKVFADKAFTKASRVTSNGLRSSWSSESAEMFNLDFDSKRKVSQDNDPCITSAKSPDGRSMFDVLDDRIESMRRQSKREMPSIKNINHERFSKSGASTDPTNCIVTLHPEPDGCPHPVISEMRIRHESVHRNSCMKANAEAEAWPQKVTGECMNYSYKMRNPILWVNEEVEAYGTGIRYLEGMFKELCL